MPLAVQMKILSQKFLGLVVLVILQKIMDVQMNLMSMMELCSVESVDVGEGQCEPGYVKQGVYCVEA